LEVMARWSSSDWPGRCAPADRSRPSPIGSHFLAHCKLMPKVG
jgi:hypothetical protein